MTESYLIIARGSICTKITHDGILYIVVLQTDQEGAETKISIFFIMYLYQALMLLSTVFDVAI